MRDALGPGTLLGYCTNVHAGATYAQTLANLERHALAVKRIVSPHAPMGLGLWLSAASARQVIEEGRTVELAAWLQERGLEVFTLNGFPHGDFHGEVVKHKVYEPDWADPRRLAYTLDLVKILAALLPEGGQGGISTLPVGWGPRLEREPGRLAAAAAQLKDLVHRLARSELDTGRMIHVDLEPEPGCHLDTADGVVRFFQRQLLGGPDDLSTLAYLRVCHDICHAAVMFEDQAAVLRHYRDAGLSVGKVQVSSAVRLDLDALPEGERAAAIERLKSFHEPRYLHQTTVRSPQAQGQARTAARSALPAPRLGTGAPAPVLYEDLSLALEQAPPRGQWRVHFHVPLFLERDGPIQTTQEQIADCVRVARDDLKVAHFEAETYAWDVLPPELRAADLAQGIAKELLWLKTAVQPR